MAYAYTARDFGTEPRNRYAAERMGVAQVRNAPAAASDVHRLASRIVMMVVLALAFGSAAVALPAASGAMENVTGIFAELAPVN